MQVRHASFAPKCLLAVAVLTLSLWSGIKGAHAQAAAAAPISAGPTDTPPPAGLSGPAFINRTWTLPLRFEQNAGQLAPGTNFLGRTSEYAVAIKPCGLQFSLPQASPVAVTFEGSRGGMGEGLTPVLSRTNDYHGSDPRQWHTNIINFNRVGLRAVYQGIDMEFYGSGERMEHDFIVAPGSDPRSIRLLIQGLAKLTPERDLIIGANSRGALRFGRPLAYQTGDRGERIAVPVDYHLSGAGKQRTRISFQIGAYDHTRTLIIDPVITYATYVTGSAVSLGASVVTDPAGNVFLFGSTNSSTTSFGVGSPSTAGPGTDLFLAKISSTSGGSQLAWITFFGGSAASTPTAAVYSAAATPSVFVTGSTAASDFPMASSGFQGTLLSGAVSGFAAGFDASTGSIVAATYIETNPGSASDTTTVTSITSDPPGHIYVGGYGAGSSLPLSQALAVTGSALASSESSANAFILELSRNLSTEVLGTYLVAEQSVPAATMIHAIGVDNGGRIYAAGSVTGQFPDANAFTGGGTYVPADVYPAPPANGTYGFLVQLNPSGAVSTPSVLGYSLSLQGGATTIANSLFTKADGSGYVAGTTGDTTATPSNLIGGIYSSVNGGSSPVTVPDNLSAAPGLEKIVTAGVHGFVLAMPAGSTTTAVPTSFTYIGGSGTDTPRAVTYDPGSGSNPLQLLQLAGSTTSTRSSLPAAALVLPSGQDTSGDVARAFLYTLAPDLSAAPSLSYFGGANGSASAVSVAADGLNAGSAYVLVNDTRGTGAGTVSYTSASAFESNPAGESVNGTTAFAYISRVGATAALPPSSTSLTFAVAAASPSTPEVGYASGSENTTITYKWNLGNVASSQSIEDVVLNFPQAAQLGAYTLSDSAGLITNNCTSSPAGNTCVIPQIAAASTDVITLVANTAATAVVGTSFHLDGNAADAQGEYVDALQSAVTVANPVSISVTLAQSMATVDAARDLSDAGGSSHLTHITYTATVTNTSANDSPYTTMTLTLPNEFAIVGTPLLTGAGSATASSCTTTGTSSVCTLDIAAGNTATYAVTGIYLAASLPTTTPGPFTRSVSFSASALPLMPQSQKVATPLTTSINGYAAVALTVVPPPYPGTSAYKNGASTFNLGTAPLTYTLQVSNAGAGTGPDTPGGFTVLATLPSGFMVNLATLPAGVTCTTASAVPLTYGCTVTIASGVLVPGTTSTFGISGYFQDTSSAADAVPLTAPSASVSTSSTLGTVAAGTYIPPVSTAISTTVQRLVHLLATKSAAPHVAGAVNLAENQYAGSSTRMPGEHDVIDFTLQIDNSGPDKGVSITVTDALPPYFLLPAAALPTNVTCTVVNYQSYDPLAMIYTTRASGTTLSCPLATPFGPGAGATATSVGTAPLVITYWGKFLDAGLGPDLITSQDTAATAAAAQSAARDEIGGVANATSPDEIENTSPYLPAPVDTVNTISRAATIQFSTTQPIVITRTDNSALITPGAGPTPEIGECERSVNGQTYYDIAPPAPPSPSPTTGSALGKVCNLLRYQITVSNSGVNIATHPLLTTVLPPGFVLTNISLAAPFSGYPAGTLPATPRTIASDGGQIAVNSSITYYVDGYFDLGMLSATNISTTAQSIAPSLSDTAITPHLASIATASVPPIFVVNSPFNSFATPAAAYSFQPFVSGGATPLTITLTNVTNPGATGASVSTSAIALPQGISPNPIDNKAVRALYRYANSGTAAATPVPLEFGLGTTATVPASSANPTNICVAQFQGNFDKPERVLLWALANVPANTSFQSVPNITPGDITTTSNIANGTGPGATLCGVVNGLSPVADTSVTTATAGQLTLAALEPVNFAPFITGVTVQANSSQAGKGVSAEAATITVPFGQGVGTYDYNNMDPCYTGGARTTCDDNQQIASWSAYVFGGGNFLGQMNTANMITAGGSPTLSVNLPVGQTEIYVVVADRLGTQFYSSNVCDPGIADNTYTPGSNPCPTTPLTVTTPHQSVIANTHSGAEAADINTAVIGTGSGALINLPPPASQQPTAVVTAGQSAGFLWTELLPQAAGSAPSGFALSCAVLNAQASAGVSCSISPSVYPANATAAPVIYVTTTGPSLAENTLRRGGRILTLAFVLPFALLTLSLSRRRDSGLVVMLMIGAVAAMLAGCGSNNFGTSSTTATPAATYMIQATATGTVKGQPVTIQTGVFMVQVNPAH